MLEMRPGCECCDRDLPADADDAMICSFECTWCTDCATDCLGGTCANCGGALSPRPRRSGAALVKHPAATQRTVQAGLHRE